MSDRHKSFTFSGPSEYCFLLFLTVVIGPNFQQGPMYVPQKVTSLEMFVYRKKESVLLLGQSFLHLSPVAHSSNKERIHCSVDADPPHLQNWSCGGTSPLTQQKEFL